MVVVSKREQAQRLRQDGLSYREIGKRLGISGEWARQLIAFGRGGPVGRPRIHQTQAERQAAYRRRQRRKDLK